jgi:hypothetical protein
MLTLGKLQSQKNNNMEEILFLNIGDIKAGISGAMLVIRRQFLFDGEAFKSQIEVDEKKVHDAISKLTDIISGYSTAEIKFTGKDVFDVIMRIRIDKNIDYKEFLCKARDWILSNMILSFKNIPIEDSLIILEIPSSFLLKTDEMKGQVLERTIFLKQQFDKETLKKFLLKMDTEGCWKKYCVSKDKTLTNKELLDLAAKSKTFPRDLMVEIANIKE